MAGYRNTSTPTASSVRHRVRTGVSLQAQAQGVNYLQNGAKAGVTLSRQGFVQAFAAQAGVGRMGTASTGTAGSPWQAAQKQLPSATPRN